MGYARGPMFVRNLVMEVMFLTPMVWFAWNAFRSGKWGIGLVLLFGLSPFVGEG